MMKFEYQPFDLKFRHPFGVSSNVRTHTTSVFLRLVTAEHIYYGEACIPSYLGETADGVIKFFIEVCPMLADLDPEDAINRLGSLAKNASSFSRAGMAAVDILLHDRVAYQKGIKLCNWLGLRDPGAVNTAFTIGLGDKNVLEEKVAQADGHKLLKVKIGSDDDVALIKLLRTLTDKSFMVDVNQGWRDKEKALEVIGQLQQLGVVLVEQPLPVSMIAEQNWLFERSPLPLFADESVRNANDFERCGGSFHGINIKLMKSGGIMNALKLAKKAQEKGKSVMLGCMAESSCATGAMSHLLSLADHVDLDAPLLYVNDPFTGPVYDHGTIRIPQGPGTGVKPASPLGGEWISIG